MKKTMFFPAAAIAAAAAFAAVAPSDASADIRVSSWQAAQANANITLKRPTVTLGARRHRLDVYDTRAGVRAAYRNGRTSWSYTQSSKSYSGAEEHSEGSFSRHRGTVTVNGARARLSFERGAAGDYRQVVWSSGGVAYAVSNGFNCVASSVAACRSYGIGTRVMPWKNLIKIARSLKTVN